MTTWRVGRRNPESRPVEWRPVVGHEGRYEVSDRGEVRSLLSRAPRVLRASWGRYPTVSLSQKKKRVHHLVLEAFVGPRPAGMMARHADDVPTNNTVGNLSWGTASENQYDAVRNGGQFQTSKKNCKRGHKLVPPNLVRAKLLNGHRACLACNRGHTDVSKARRRHGIELDLDRQVAMRYAELMGEMT